MPAAALGLPAPGIGVGLAAVLVPLRAAAIWSKRRVGNTRGSLRVAAALTPTLNFTVVLAGILRARRSTSRRCRRATIRPGS